MTNPTIYAYLHIKGEYDLVPYSFSGALPRVGEVVIYKGQDHMVMQILHQTGAWPIIHLKLAI